MPAVETSRTAWSAARPWRRADSAAKGTAISSDSSTAAATSASVGSIRVAISVSTSIL